jgi:cytidine deaminase
MIADAGERKIIDVVIMSDKVDECPPCGSCRQRLLEFADTNTTIHLVSKNGNVIKSLPLVALLPEPFIWKKV